MPVAIKGPSDDGESTENDGTDADDEGDGREGLDSGGNADVMRVCRAAAAAIAAAAASAASTDAAPSQPRVKRYLGAKSFRWHRMEQRSQRFGSRSRKREKNVESYRLTSSASPDSSSISSCCSRCPCSFASNLAHAASLWHETKNLEYGACTCRLTLKISIASIGSDMRARKGAIVRS